MSAYAYQEVISFVLVDSPSTLDQSREGGFRIADLCPDRLHHVRFGEGCVYDDTSRITTGLPVAKCSNFLDVHYSARGIIEPGTVCCVPRSGTILSSPSPASTSTIRSSS